MITSTSNPRVQAVVRLRKRRGREAAGLFLVEGRREVERAVAAGVGIEALYMCPELGGTAPEAGAAADPTEVSAAVFAKLSYREGPDGVLAVARAFPTDLGRLAPPADALVLVVAGLEKPGNLGAVVRSAAAAGAYAVVAADPVTDVFNPNTVRASQGALFSLPVAVGEAAEVRTWLDRHHVPAYAAGPKGSSLAPWDLPLAAAAALVVGAEDRGLDDAWFDHAAAPVSIPMPGARQGVDSLNAASAAAVLLFEAVRQRAAATPAPAG
ncbi:MAG TPA: RNA methyltransferase [Acidimicrobiales bacterium]|nr:RNA methyltransferase [Acidimicrobiales bacterium]